MKAKNTDKLFIYFPKEIWMDTNQLNNYKEIIYANCQQCANWFMKRFKCKLEPIGLYQEPHFAYVNTIEAKILSKFGNFNVGFSIWTDSSTGDPEWETDNVEYAILRAKLPEITYKVMGENINLKRETQRLKRKLSKIEN